MNEVDELLLEHFGTRGMKWGVRKAPGVSPRVNREARRDAEEHARAKLFFGEGAGTRRKLIKARVEEKTKRVPGYQKAFDHHLARQDMSVHATKAVSERKRKDTTKRTKQRAGALARNFTGEMGTQAAFVGVAIAGVAFMRSAKGQAITRQVVSKIQSSQQARSGAKLVGDFLKSQGR